MNALDQSTIAQLEASLRAADLVPILRAFEVDLGRLTTDYAAAAAAGSESARRAAHSLAGTAAGIGAKRLEAAARRAMAPDGVDHAMLNAAIREEADAALAEIAALAARLGG